MSYKLLSVEDLLQLKQDKLSEGQLASANSGITQLKVVANENHISNSGIHVTAEQKAAWSAKQDAIAAFLKDAVVNGGVLTITKKDGSTVQFQGESSAWADITGKPQSFTPTAHQHTKSQITDFGGPYIPDNGGLIYRDDQNAIYVSGGWSLFVTEGAEFDSQPGSSIKKEGKEVATVDQVALKANSDIAADNYDATETYAVGDYVTYNGYMYRCNTAIETAEAWNADHWDKKRFADPDYQFGLDDDTRALSVLKKDEDGEWQTHWSELDLARYELKTVASGGTISDRAVSSITASAAVSFALPGAASRKDKDGNAVRMCRDFALAVTNTASDGIAVNFTNSTLPTFKKESSETISEFLTADGEATTVFYFAEIAADVFMVAKKVVA